MAGDGFMLNLVSVLQLLCVKVKQDKVDPVYLYTDNCSLSLNATDDSRLMSTCKDYKEYKEKEEKGNEEGKSSNVNVSVDSSDLS